MLGKRSRASQMMKRTTSMTGITTAVDPSGKIINVDESPPVDHLHRQNPLTGNEIGDCGDGGGHHLHVAEGPSAAVMVGPSATNPTSSEAVTDHHHHQRFTAVLSPRYNYMRDHHRGGLGTANFLRSCGLCNRRLAPGRDIFMYRGDTAFCSQECREQRMKQDERKEKHNNKVAVVTSKKYSDQLNPPAADSSGNTETLAAA